MAARLSADTPTHIETNYQYDGLNRVTTKTYNDGTPHVSYC
jgi:YD repeat-containing protein